MIQIEHLPNAVWEVLVIKYTQNFLKKFNIVPLMTCKNPNLFSILFIIFI